MTAYGSQFRTARQRRGQRNHLAGQAAEMQIARYYERRGYRLMHARWRGRAGELDLVMQGIEQVVFIEVKSSKTLAGAIEMVTPAKLGRITQVAGEYLGGLPSGELTPSRVDIACVDRQGSIEVTENVICH